MKMKRVVPHQQVQEAVAQTAKEWATIFDAISDLVSLHDRNFRLIRVNKAFAAAFKKRPEELVGRKCYAVIHGSKKPPKNCPHSKVLQTESPTQMELFEPHLGCTLDVSASPIFDQRGKLTGSVHIVKDITARRRAEDALADEKEWLAVTLRNIGDGVIATDIDGHVILLNKVSEKLTGWSQEEARGKPFREVFNIINEETGKVCENPIGRVLEKGTIVGLANHTALIARDGTQRSIADSAAPIRDRYGKTIGVILVFRDVTEQGKTAEALLFKTILLETQLETSIDGILVIDNKGYSILSNKRFGEIWKIPQGILDTKDDKTMLEYVLKQLKDPVEFNRKVAYCYEHKDEENRDEIEFADGRCIDRYSSPLISADGKYHGRIWYFRDITARKEMENQLVASEKIAAIGHFVTGTAHELNNPLATMISFSETMLGKLKGAKGDAGKLRESAEIVLRNAIRCEAIVTSLMSYGRTQASQFILLDVNEVIDKSLTLAESYCRLEGINIHKGYSAGLPPVTGNKEQLTQVFTNIIRNAVQAMKSRGELRIETKAEGKTVSVVFTDSGEGIAPDKLPKLFYPFFTTREPGQGTGLGLSVSAGIIRAHNGKITAASPGKGKGASFTVSLPITAEDVKHG
ncbi:MAG: PAS domain-containing protein [Elusimicrobiota bacterium]